MLPRCWLGGLEEGIGSWVLRAPFVAVAGAGDESAE